ncbi:uncharacterized protein [Oscarella lobularis]|uniref:uncharacterized protein isoform X2 n=1 Tax=Oscarella lobularis TaxID=121494 RepID=UPI0033132FE8
MNRRKKIDHRYLGNSHSGFLVFITTIARGALVIRRILIGFPTPWGLYRTRGDSLDMIASRSLLVFSSLFLFLLTADDADGFLWRRRRRRACTASVWSRWSNCTCALGAAKGTQTRRQTKLGNCTDTSDEVQTQDCTSTQLVCSTNDNAPVFSRDQYEAEVTLGESPGHRVMNVKATDADSGLKGEIVFSFQTEQDYFAINLSTGVVIVARELDAQTYNSYELTIAATDRGTPAMTGTSTIHITVVCSSSGQCPLTRSNTGVVSGATVGVVVGAVIVVVTVTVIVVVVVRVRKRLGGHSRSPVFSEEQEGESVVTPILNEVELEFIGTQSNEDETAATEPSDESVGEYAEAEEGQTSAREETSTV